MSTGGTSNPRLGRFEGDKGRPGRDHPVARGRGPQVFDQLGLDSHPGFLEHLGSNSLFHDLLHSGHAGLAGGKHMNTFGDRSVLIPYVIGKIFFLKATSAVSAS